MRSTVIHTLCQSYLGIDHNEHGSEQPWTSSNTEFLLTQWSIVRWRILHETLLHVKRTEADSAL